VRRARLLAAAAALAAAALPTAAGAFPIPGPLSGPLPRFTGAPATAQRLPGPYPPANPALAPDGRNGSGLSAGNGAASPYAGPLGHGTASVSALGLGGCAALAFDARDRLLAMCNGPLAPELRLLDPRTLAQVANLILPQHLRTKLGDFAGATHFIERADGSLLIPAHDGTLLSVAVEPGALRKTGVVSLTKLLGSGERPFAVAAGFDGFDWAVGDRGTVVTVPRAAQGPEASAAPRKLWLGEPVQEDIATDPTGTYVVTTAALYRLRADTSGAPRIVWRLPLPSALSDGHGGRVHDGPGTPPVIVAGRYVAVADALDPARVVVARITGTDARRMYCAVPVFAPGRSSVEAHLVVAGRSIAVANSYGLDNLFTTEGGRTTTGGIARVVVGRRGCRTARTVPVISPSAQMVVSRATGLLYPLEKPKGFPDAWNLAAVDWRSGAKRFAALAGEGLGYNSDGGAVVLGPDGAAYAGTFGGVVRFADAG
jgi:hypothetical protein